MGNLLISDLLLKCEIGGLYSLPLDGLGDLIGESNFVLMGVDADFNSLVDGGCIDIPCHALDIFPYLSKRVDVLRRRIHNHLPKVNIKPGTGGRGNHFPGIESWEEIPHSTAIM